MELAHQEAVKTLKMVRRKNITSLGTPELNDLSPSLLLWCRNTISMLLE